MPGDNGDGRNFLLALDARQKGPSMEETNTPLHRRNKQESRLKRDGKGQKQTVITMGGGDDVEWNGGITVLRISEGESSFDWNDGIGNATIEPPNPSWHRY